MFESLLSMTAEAVVRAETGEKKTVAGACQKRTGSATLVTVHAMFACYERVFYKKGKNFDLTNKDILFCITGIGPPFR